MHWPRYDLDYTFLLLTFVRELSPGPLTRAQPTVSPSRSIRASASYGACTLTSLSK